MFHVEHTTGGRRGRQADPARAVGAGGTTEARKPHRPTLPPAPAGRAGGGLPPPHGQGRRGQTHGTESAPRKEAPQHGRGRLAAPAGAATARAGAACRPRLPSHST